MTEAKVFMEQFMEKLNNGYFNTVDDEEWIVEFVNKLYHKDMKQIDDFEVCSLQKLYETWEVLMEKDYAERKKLELEQLVNVRDIAKNDV